MTDYEQVVDSLRYGIPPQGHLRRLTAARPTELARLERAVTGDGPSRSYLVRGAYGAGKSHWLQLAREIALEEGFVISRVTLNAHGGVRFNRMDQVFGAVSAGIELPDGRTRVGALLASRWEYDPHLLEARNVSAAHRVWTYSARPAEARPEIIDWLESPWKYTSLGRMPRALQSSLASGREVSFRSNQYSQSWAGLNAYNSLAKLAGFRGLVILVDEFEDVITNIRNVRWEGVALANLARLLGGEFAGSCFFAVTPEFEDKVLHSQTGRDEHVINDLTELLKDPDLRFDIVRPSAKDFMRVARTVRTFHGEAYRWDAQAQVSDSELADVVRPAFRNAGVDQSRQAMRAVVDHLDHAIERDA